MRTRKPKKFYATRGALQAEGSTKSEAKANLDKMVDWACNHASTTIEARFGLLLVVSASPQGWQHTIVAPEHIAKHGERRNTCTFHGQVEYTDVLIAARSHAAQWAWNADVADDEAFIGMAGLDEQSATGLRSWIRFQRNYIALKANGASNAEAFENANRIAA